MRKYLIIKGVGILILVFACICCNNINDQSKEFNLIEATISDIHQAFQDYELTSEELVEMYIKRINFYDQSTKLNSIVVKNNEALETARLLDKEFKETGKLRPLHGIPVIVKDNYQTIRLQTAAGSLALKGFIPGEDADQVARLKEAGVIVLVKSNMAEWAFSPMVTISSIAGETRNPYNLDHVPAGSSGGTAASVAANFGTVGLGTDTGNSIRGPSSHNALVGFRTTLGLISRHGIVPLYLRNDVGGPMCRTVEDATRVMEVLAGYDPKDPLTIHCEGKIPDNYTQFLDKNGLQGARIGVLRQLSDRDPDPQIAALFEQAITDLKELGAEIVDPFVVPDFDSLSQGHWCSVFKKDLNEFLAGHADNVPVKTLKEVVESGLYSDYIKDDLEYFLNLDMDDTDNNISECLEVYDDPHRISFREAIVQMMDSLNVGAVIYPTWNHPPAKIGDFEGYKGDNSQIIAPHTGQPAFTIPMGFTYDNLPAGLQFLGRPFDEPTLVKYCYAYEQGTLHRKSPESFPKLD